jgi:aminoacrylate peracid reductase
VIIGDMIRPGALLEIQVTAVPRGAERKAILPRGWKKPASPYSYAMKSGDTLYMSGLVSTNPITNSRVEGDIASQVKTAMANAGAILQSAGMSYGDIAAGRVALRDTVAHFQPMNDVYRTYWEKNPPARISYQSELRDGADVEISFVAIKGSSPREVIVPPRPDGSPGQLNPNFSPGIKVGNRLFTSGGTGTTGTNVGDMKGQTAETLSRLGRTLQAAGFEFKDVVTSDVFLTDVSKLDQMNEAYRPVFPTDAPTRATVGVNRFANINVLIEITLMAAKP